MPWDTLISAFVVLLVVIDPIGVAAIFYALTLNAPEPQRRRMALRGSILAGVILLAFFFAGHWLLRMLGISIPAFRIAGGILLFLLAIDMIFARQSGLRSATPDEQLEALERPDLSVFPLAFPLLAGPGALTSVLLMAADQTYSWVSLMILAELLGILFLALICLIYAPALMRLLGETGTNVISRVLGLILAALAVQFVLDGLSASLQGIIPGLKV